MKVFGVGMRKNRVFRENLYERTRSSRGKSFGSLYGGGGRLDAVIHSFPYTSCCTQSLVSYGIRREVYKTESGFEVLI